MNGLKVTLLAGAAMLAMAGGASAVTISGGSASLTNTLTDYNTQLLGTLNKFDTSLGTLNSVTFTYGFGFSSTITITAQTNSSGSVRTESAAQFYSTDSSINNVLNSLVNTTQATIGANSLIPAAYDLLGTTRSYNVTGGQSQNYSSNVGTNSQSITSTQSSDYAPFEAAGGGTFTVFGQTLTGTVQVNSGGNNSASQQTYANQSISVSYDYTAAPTPPPTGVPEPASLALLGAGLLGLGMIRRKSA